MRNCVLSGLPALILQRAEKRQVHIEKIVLDKMEGVECV